MRTSALVRVAVTLAATTTTLALAAPGAQALLPDPAAPVVTNDAVSVYPFGSTSVNVLANDTDPGDPDGSSLAVCRLPELDPDSIMSPGDLPDVVALDAGNILGPTGSLYVMALKGKMKKPFDLDYYVCNYTHLTPATLTVTMRETKPVTVHKVKGKPGRLKITNRNDSRITLVTYSNTDEDELGDVVRVPAHASKTFEPSEKTVHWIAVIGNERNNGIAGHGVVRHVKVDPDHQAKPGKGDLVSVPGIFRALIERVR